MVFPGFVNTDISKNALTAATGKFVFIIVWAIRLMTDVMFCLQVPRLRDPAANGRWLRRPRAAADVRDQTRRRR